MEWFLKTVSFKKDFMTAYNLLCVGGVDLILFIGVFLYLCLSKKITDQTVWTAISLVLFLDFVLVEILVFWKYHN